MSELTQKNEAQNEMAEKSPRPTMADFVQARKELLAIEAKEVSQFAVGKVIGISLLAFGMLFFWMLLLCAAISFGGKWLAERYEGVGWEALAAGIAGVHLLLGLIGLAKLKSKPSNKFFQYSLQEIKNDRQWLTNNKKGS